MKDHRDRFGAVEISPRARDPLIQYQKSSSSVSASSQMSASGFSSQQFQSQSTYQQQHHIQPQNVSFTIVSAVSLRSASKNLISNPHCEVSLVAKASAPSGGATTTAAAGSGAAPGTHEVRRTLRSSTVKGSMNPIWNFKADFGVVDPRQIVGLLFHVRHTEKMGVVKKDLGQLWLSIREVFDLQKRGEERAFHLQPPDMHKEKDFDDLVSNRNYGKLVLRMDLIGADEGSNQEQEQRETLPLARRSKNSANNNGNSYESSDKRPFRDTAGSGSIAKEDEFAFSMKKNSERAHNALDELKRIRACHQSHPKPGEMWYAIASSWVTEWLLFVSQHKNQDPFSTGPGPIPNVSLVSNDSGNGAMRPRADVSIKRDFRVVNKKTWDLYHKMYGGGPVIEVRVPNNCPDPSAWLKTIQLHEVGKVVSSYM